MRPKWRTVTIGGGPCGGAPAVPVADGEAGARFSSDTRAVMAGVRSMAGL